MLVSFSVSLLTRNRAWST